MDDKHESNSKTDQFGEELKPKGSRKVFIVSILAFSLVVITAAAYFFLIQQKQNGNEAIAYRDSLSSILKKPSNNNNNNGGVKNTGIKINPATNKQSDKPESNTSLKDNGGIAESFKEALELMRKKQQNIINKLTKANQQSLNEIKDSIAENQRSNKLDQHRLIEKTNQNQQTIFEKLRSLFEAKNEKSEAENFATLKPKVGFELVGISLWDSVPKAEIRYQGHISIVSIGSIRLNWKVIDINFDKEQITVIKNGQKAVLEKII